MFCPKCGGNNPETGKFCRSCGTGLDNVSSALAAKPQTHKLVDRKGKPLNWEGAITKIFTGFAFIAVTIALAFSQMGRGWWFWMLIPAFSSLGAGVAQYIQLRKAEKGQPALPSFKPETLPESKNDQLLAFNNPESRYKTGDLVPASVTENTTRHLEMDSESRTKALPRK